MSDIEKLIKTRIEIEPLEFDEDRPRISEQGRINDGRRMYRAHNDDDNGAMAESRTGHDARPARERRERREAPPHRQSVAPRDPFFDLPYEPSAAPDAQPAWEAAAKAAPARSGVSANIKPRKKVAALFKTAS